MKFNHNFTREDGILLGFYKIKKFELMPDENKGIALLHCFVDEAAYLAGKPFVMQHYQEFSFDSSDNDLDKVMKKIEPVVAAAFIASKQVV